MSNNKKKEKGSFLGKLFGAIGLGASLYGLKKVVDLYVETENENKNLIDSSDYEDLIKIEKNYYQLDMDEGLFDYNKIGLDYDSDKLFEKFLKKVELTNEIPDKIFKISDIEKLVPFEGGGFEKRDSYDYSVLVMLGGQNERDYFIYKDMLGLRDVFTEEANNPDGDSSIWKKRYSDERFIINPKYYLNEDKEGKGVE